MMKFHNIFIIFIIYNIYVIYSYLIFPLEYLPDKNYKFIDNESKDEFIPEKLMKQIYYRNFITQIKIGTPSKDINLLIQTNSDKFYISSVNPSINSTEKEQNFFQFSKDEYYNELLSNTYKNATCKKNTYSFNPYDEICESNETINFNINQTNKRNEFPITLVRNYDEKITGYLGLLHNDLEFHTTNNLITNSKSKKIIDNYYWFFDFDEYDPLNKKLKGNLIIGGESHEIFPNKYSFDDLESTSSYKASHAGRSWRLLVNKIYIDNNSNNSISIPSRIVTFNFEIYNIVTTMEFHNLIKTLVMNELINENKCFNSNFTQNIYKVQNQNLSFYYCDKSTKNTLYEKIPNLKFTSTELNIIFELTKEELFYEKGDYIYFMILFANQPNTDWILGQMFTKKYNFCFNNDNHQIRLYKKIYNGTTNKNGNTNSVNMYNLSKGGLIAMIAVVEGIILLAVGIFIGKKIFGKKMENNQGKELDNDPKYDKSTKYNYSINSFNQDNIEKNNIFFKNQNEQAPIRENNKSIN